MIFLSYFVILLCIIEISYGNVLSDSVFTNAGILMNNGNKKMVCSFTCIKVDKPPSSPCDHNITTTTTKQPCPLENTTLPPTNPPPSTPKPTTAHTVTTEAISSTKMSAALTSTSVTPVSHLSSTANPLTILPPLSTKTSTLSNPNTTISTTSTYGNKTKSICINGLGHYVTWDGAYFEYHGTCPYTFVKPCTSTSMPDIDNFSIKAQNKYVGTFGNQQAEIESVQFEMFHQNITMTYKGDLYVNEKRQYFAFLFPNEEAPILTIRENGWLKTIETRHGINLEFNGFTVCVSIPESEAFYGKEKLCGLGGNYDGICSNDMVYKNGTLFSNQTKKCRYDNNVNDWANDYIITNYFHPDNTTMNCNVGRNTVVDTTQCNTDLCNPISEAALGKGVFGQCKAMGNNVIDRMFRVCTSDFCANQDYLCKSLEDFARECQRIVDGTDLGDWRAAVKCPAVQCPANSAFKTCSACQPTCFDPNPAECNPNNCIEGCQCDVGYFADSTKTPFSCIKAEECKCVDTFKRKPWITQNCTMSNTCWMGVRANRPYKCDMNEKCILETNQERCQSLKCPEGWRYFSNTEACYKIIYKVNFYDAKEKCQKMDSYLTSINSAEENEFIRGIVHVGTREVMFEDNTYIGFKDDKWIDGTPVNYTNKAAEPNRSHLENVDFCWYMNSDNYYSNYPDMQGKWYLTDCNFRFRTAICKKLQSS